MQPVKVFLVDDQQLVRAGFRMVIDSQPDLEVVGEAGDGDAALHALAVTAADVVLMDVRMPVLDGVEATRRLRTRDDAPKVIVLTTFDLDEYAFAAIKAGASGFLLKDAPPPTLLDAVRTVHSGDAVVAPSTTRRLLERFAGHLPEDATPPDAVWAELTQREHEIVREVVRGRSNAEIAATLFVTEATVKTHIGRVLAKVGLRDRVQLVVLAYETGLVRPGAS
ncbi:DNA-binding response regulator, NarL/FixJ family, contains REC and HTH domains [Jiangella alkaliphila]|uniref:DNA-binding response regulator, NarL/FixJ family, contains REC and HTH domains n=1 Tax=Jiangella alkaliphila TaxID=419479 RepID=A0A1H2IBP5_9ACTN|nr:DNA-binding response regulator, NarL/FixJ family, contains REC and HTH domains [Jiangella alkaliphila]